MSQDLAVSQTASLLQNIKAKMTGAFANIAPDESLSDGIGSSYGIIHYRGKNWSLSYRGATHLFTRPDDGSPSSYIDVVILRQARSKSKSLYEGFDQDASSKRPICASLDGERPDADAQTPQAVACAVCPRNAWKTDAAGKRSKDCSDYKRLAVLLMPTVSSRMFNGVPLMEPVFLRVPAASLSDLATFGDQLNQAGLPYFGIVTRVSFDPTKAHPQMQFRPLQGLTEAEEPVVMPMRDENTTKRIVGDDKPKMLSLPSNVVQLQQPQVINQPQMQVVSPQQQVFVQPQPLAPVQTMQPIVMAPAPTPQPIYVAPQPQPEPTSVETGFGGIPNTHTFTPAVQQTGPAVAGPQIDVGAPIEADAIIDGRLAGLFPAAGA